MHKLSSGRVLAVALGLALLLLLASASPHAGVAHDRAQDRAAAEASTQPTLTVEVGLDNEIFPVFANYAAMQRPDGRKWGTVAVQVTNSTSSAIRRRVSVEVPGWSDREIQIVTLAAGESRKLLFAPTFLPRLFSNRRLEAATVLVTAADPATRSHTALTVPVRLRPAGDMYWGKGFKFAPFIASWVTPHDPQVEAILSRAKEFMPGRRLPGYESWKTTELQEKSTRAQAAAIYRALQEKGVSYVKSSGVFGAHEAVSQRVRMPGESLLHASANCIDGVVLYASLFENLGMEPVIILVPGHAYVGVRLSQSGNRYLVIDTALIGRAGFEAALTAAQKGVQRYTSAQTTRIFVRKARLSGIYPMPPAESAAVIPAAATSAP